MTAVSFPSRSAILSVAVAALSSVSWLVMAAAAQAVPQPAPTTAPATAPSSALASTLPAVDSSLVTVAVPHVLIVSIDGLRPDCLLRADAPTLRSLMARGSFTLWARTTDVAVTTPSHVSMLTGVTPERHGITFNADPPEDARILVPTLFDLAHRAGLSTAMASGKRKFSLITRGGSVDHAKLPAESAVSDAPVAGWAEQIIHEHQPRVMLVHFAGADNVGHGKGWGTPQQLEVIGSIDRELAKVLRAYETAGLAESTYIIISADHGGSMRNHGRDDVRSRYIPWILVGPGVREDYDLTRLGKDYEVATYDTFATAAYLLGLRIPPDSDGKPILPAFSEYDLMSDVPAATTKPTTRP